MIVENICSFIWPPCHKSIYFYLVNLLFTDYLVMLPETNDIYRKEAGPESSSKIWKWYLIYASGCWWWYSECFNWFSEIIPTFDTGAHVGKLVPYLAVQNSPKQEPDLHTPSYQISLIKRSLCVKTGVAEKGESRGEDQASHKLPLTLIILLSKSTGTFHSKWSFSHCG